MNNDDHALYDTFASEEITPPYSEHWEAKRRVAQALRDLTNVLMTSTPPTQELNRIAQRLELETQEFAKTDRLFGLIEFCRDGNHGSYGQVNHEMNGVGGWSNPLNPGLNLWLDGDKAYGTVRFGWAYEGPPGHVHGGYIAAVLDQFLGMAQMATRQSGMTGSLKVNYHRPTPLNTDLTLEAETTILSERKIRVVGRILLDGQVTAEGDGLFIRPKGGMVRV